jgi:hypothetical protein
LANIDGAMSRFVMGNFTSFDRALSWISISNQSEFHYFGGKNFNGHNCHLIRCFVEQLCLRLARDTFLFSIFNDMAVGTGCS